MQFWNFKRVAIAAVLLVTTIAVISLFKGLTGYVEISEFHVWQGITGNVDVIDTPGYYANNFGKSWEYPKNAQKYWSKSTKEGDPTADDSIRVTFNDAGRGQISTFIQISLPSSKEQRLKLQERFSGQMENILAAVHAHLSNCIKNSGPLMSASENQASRKAEFTQVVEDQLKNGLFEMRRTRVQLKDRVDEKGLPIWVEANEVVLDDKGVPRRQEISPLKEYGIVVNQFSVTETEYDELTVAQFRAKQEAFLSAERSKAEREKEVQQRLMVQAQGERQAAEETAKGNVLKAQQEVAGQTKVAVAQQAKLEAETLASQKVAVALKDKEAAETAANQAAEVARIKADQEKIVAVTAAQASKESSALQLEADKLKGQGIIALAEAEQKRIQLAGAVKDSDKVLATIQANRDVEVAKYLSGIAVPGNIILSGGAGGIGGGTQTASAGGSMSGIDPFLLNMTLLKSSGLLDLERKPISRTAEAPAPAAKQ